MENGYKVPHVGADCEVFLTKDGKPYPVVGLLGGTKAEPKPILDILGPGYAVQEDNVMPEFNIPPCTSAKEFDAAIKAVLDYLESFFAPQGLGISIQSYAHFDKDLLTSKQARTFGCEPDYNAWTLEENEIDNLHPTLKTMRTAAAHVHVELLRSDGSKPEIPELIAFVKMLDVYLAVPFGILEPDGNVRRQFYGRAGSFRLKPYGIEFRTLSNLWISNPTWRQFVFNGVQYVASRCMSNWETAIKEYDNRADVIVQSINACNYAQRQLHWLADHWCVHIPYLAPKVRKKTSPPKDIVEAIIPNLWDTTYITSPSEAMEATLDDLEQDEQSNPSQA